MEMIDNVNKLLKDDLKVTIKKNSKVSIFYINDVHGQIPMLMMS